MSGIPEEKLVEAHGGFSTASCIRCFKKHDPHKTREDILQGKIVYCDRSFCKVRIYLHLKHVWMYQRNETRLYSQGWQPFLSLFAIHEDENCLHRGTKISFSSTCTHMQNNILLSSLRLFFK